MGLAAGKRLTWDFLGRWKLQAQLHVWSVMKQSSMETLAKTISFACKSVKHGKNKNIFTAEWLDIHVVFQQVTSLRDSSQYTSNLYKKMGAFCALISVINGLEPISEHLDP